MIIGKKKQFLSNKKKVVAIKTNLIASEKAREIEMADFYVNKLIKRNLRNRYSLFHILVKRNLKIFQVINFKILNSNSIELI